MSLVLPAYNSGPAIVRTWDEVRIFLEWQPDSWEVIFVCDGCTDGTRERLAKLADDANDPRLKVLSYRQNRGKGYAVRTGLLAARGDYRIFTDVDLAYSFDDIRRLAERLQNGTPVAIASRQHPESQLILPVNVIGYLHRRQLQSQVFGWLTRRLLPLKQRDTQAGLKGMSAEVAQWILPQLTCDGFGFDCELLTVCERAGLWIEEIPVCVRYETGASTTGGRTALRMFRELWSIRQTWRQRPIVGTLPKAQRHLPNAA